jgi:PAS domain S-box-containing protein
MTTSTLIVRLKISGILRRIVNLVIWIVEPHATTEEKQRRRVSVFSALLIIMALNALSGALILRSDTDFSWIILLVSAGVLTVGYILNRTGFCNIATFIAITIPYLAPIIMIILSVDQSTSASILMWPTLSLFISSLLLSLRYTLITGFSYLIVLFLLVFTNNFNPDIHPEIISFVFMIFFFVIVITSVRRADQAEAEHELAERRQAEKALKEREKRFSDIAENAPEWIWEVNNEGKYIYSSRVVEKLLGYTPEEMLQRHFYDSFHPSEREELKKKAFEAFAQKQPFQGLINQNIHKNGKEVYLSTSGVPILDEEGNCAGYRGIDIDITERLKLEQLQNDEIYVLTLIGRGAKLDEVLDAIVNLGEYHDTAVSCSVMLYDASKELLFQASAPHFSDAYIESLKDGLPLGPVMGACGTAAYLKERVIIPDIKNSPLFAPFEEAVKTITGEGLLACWSQPILSPSGELLGTIANYSHKLGEPSEENLRVLEWSARIAGIAIERKRAEEKLANEAISRRILVEQSIDGIVILNQEGGVYEANLRFAEMLGYTMEETLQLHMWDWDTQWTKEQLLEKVKDVGVEGEHFETYWQRKDGTNFDVEISTNGAIFAGQKLVFCVCRDITGRKRAEEKIRQSEKRYRLLAENQTDVIWTVEANNPSNIIYISPSVTYLLGFSTEEFTEREIGQLFTPSSVETITKTIAKNMNIEESVRGDALRTETIQLEMYRKDGSTVPVEIKSSFIYGTEGHPNEVLVVARDVTERVKAEKALRESEEKFSKAFHASPQQIILTRLSDNITIDANDSYINASGFSREELIGHTATELGVWMTPDDESRIHQQLKEQGRLYNEEFQFRKKSGEIQTKLLSVEPIEIGGEECIISILTDITERKRMEDELRSNEERFRLIADNSADLISRISATPEIHTDYVSPSCLRITGYTQDEFYADRNLGLNMIHPEDRETFLSIAEQDNKNLDKAITIRLVRKDGEIVWVEQTQSMITDEDGEVQAIHLIAHDITERVESEQALRESEEKFSKAFRSSPQHIIISKLEDGKAIEVNDSFVRDTGYTYKEIIGRSLIDIGLWVHPEDRLKMIKELKQKGRVNNEEYEFKMKGGEIRTELFSAELINLGGEECLIAILTDITERKRIEASLRESQEQFSRIFHTSPGPVFICRIRDFVFLDVNQSFMSLTGFQKEGLIGKGADEFDFWISEEQREQLFQTARNKIKISNLETQFYMKPGKIHTMLFSNEFIQFDGEECMLGVATDITELKLADDQLKQAMSELKYANEKLSATNKELEAFSYSVSHDLRSPLRSIDGFSQALLEDYTEKLDDTGRDYLQRLRGASQKMGELIDGILRLSRLTRGEMHEEEVDLSQIAKDITARFKQTFPKRKADFIIDEGLTVKGDRQLLNALMENLLSNAWKFTSKVPRAKIEFGSVQNGDVRSYYVRDNGAGFDMNYADKLFGVFQRLHDNTEFPGTGIGLATVQRIINRHGGSITAEGKLGEGATFSFTLN